MSRKPRQYGHPIPVPQWWLDALTAALDIARRGFGLNQKAVAQRLREVLGQDFDDNVITRCKTGEITTLEVVVALTDLLDLPPPVWMPASEDDARWLKQAQHMRGVRPSVPPLILIAPSLKTSGVAGPPAKSPPRDRPAAVPIEPHIRRRKAGGGRR